MAEDSAADAAPPEPAAAGRTVATKTYPVGQLMKIEFEAALTAEATEDHIREWVLSALGIGGIWKDNPLFNDEPEPFAGCVTITNTGFRGRREEFDHQTLPDGSRTMKVRYVRY